MQDFSIEMETMSARKESASGEAARLLRLRETECPGLRGSLTKLEMTWCKLTSDLTSAQDRLQKVQMTACEHVHISIQ